MNELTESEARRHAEAAFEGLKALALVIRDLRQVPSGELYARIMNRVSLEDYTRLIAILKRSGLVIERNHLLIWNEAQTDNTNQPKGIIHHG